MMRSEMMGPNTPQSSSSCTPTISIVHTHIHSGLLSAGACPLFAEMCLDLMAKEQHAQLPVRSLVHGLGLHAHLVLVGGQLVGAVLLVPEMEEAAGGRAHHHQVAVQVLAVQVHVLAAPALDVNIEAT